MVYTPHKKKKKKNSKKKKKECDKMTTFFIKGRINYLLNNRFNKNIFNRSFSTLHFNDKYSKNSFKLNKKIIFNRAFSTLLLMIEPVLVID